MKTRVLGQFLFYSSNIRGTRGRCLVILPPEKSQSTLVPTFRVSLENVREQLLGNRFQSFTVEHEASGGLPVVREQETRNVFDRGKRQMLGNKYRLTRRRQLGARVNITDLTYGGLNTCVHSNLCFSRESGASRF